MDALLRFSAALALAGGCAAQISLTMSAATPVTVAAETPTGVVTQSVPAGPLAPSFQLQTPNATTGNFGFFNQFTLVDQTAVSVQFSHIVQSTYASPNVVASAGPHVIVMELQSPVPVQVRAEFDFYHGGTPGVPFPLVEVDVGNDGLREFANGSPTGSGQWTVGPQPLQVRVELATELDVFGTSEFTLGVRILPDTNTVVDLAAIGCVATTPPFSVEPSFVDTGIELFAPTFQISPGVLVFGSNPAPVLLPLPFGPPCLLYPSVDVAVLATALPQNVAIPAAVRPATFWCQCVYVNLANLQLLTTDAFRVRAF